MSRVSYKRQDNSSRQRARLIACFAILTVCSIIILSLAYSIVGICAERHSAKVQMAYINTIDKALAEEARDQLNELGYRNSGVSVSCVIEEDGNIIQTVTVHHSRIDSMQDDQREVLAEALSAELNGAEIEFLYAD